MSYQDPPRRQRPSRYQALAQYGDSYQSYQDPQADYPYQDGHSGFAGLAGRGTREQRPPWDEPAQPTTQDTPEQRTTWGAPGQQTTWDTPEQRTTWGAPEQQTTWGTPGQQTTWDTPEQRTTWDAPEQRTTWDERGQQTRWDITAQDGADMPRRASGPFFAIPDDEDEGAGRRSGRRSRGLLAGGTVGFLAAAMAIGVANLTAAFVRPQASPVIAVGGWFIDHTPPALKNFAVQKFGENDKNMLLLGMYVTIAIIAIVVGILAWRRVSIGVAGIGLFGLFGAYIAVTRPESHVTDVIPSIVGGIVGIAVIVWLVRIGAAKPIGAAWTSRARGTRRGAVWTGGNS